MTVASMGNHRMKKRVDQLVELEGGNGKEIRSEGAPNQKKVEKHWVKLS